MTLLQHSLDNVYYILIYDRFIVTLSELTKEQLYDNTKVNNFIFLRRLCTNVTINVQTKTPSNVLGI